MSNKPTAEHCLRECEKGREKGVLLCTSKWQHALENSSSSIQTTEHPVQPKPGKVTFY